MKQNLIPNWKKTIFTKITTFLKFGERLEEYKNTTNLSLKLVLLMNSEHSKLGSVHPNIEV